MKAFSELVALANAKLAQLREYEARRVQSSGGQGRAYIEPSEPVEGESPIDRARRLQDALGYRGYPDRESLQFFPWSPETWFKIAPEVSPGGSVPYRGLPGDVIEPPADVYGLGRRISPDEWKFGKPREPWTMVPQDERFARLFYKPFRGLFQA